MPSTITDQLLTLADNFRRRRERLRMTLWDLHIALDVPIVVLEALEDHGAVSLRTLLLVAGALGVTPQHLLRRCTPLRVTRTPRGASPAPGSPSPAQRRAAKGRRTPRS